MFMIKKLAQYVGEYKRDSLLAPLLVSMEVVLEVLIPFFMSMLIDNGIEKGDMGYIGRMALVMVLTALMSLLFGVLSGRFAARASCGFAKNVRKGIYGRIQTFSFANIDRFSTAGLVTRLTTDVTNVQNAYQMIVRVMVRCPVMLLFALVMGFRLNARLALVFVGAIIVLGGGLMFLIFNAHPIFKKVFRLYDKLNLAVQENVRGIRVSKAFVREDLENSKFDAVSDDIYKNFMRAEKIVAFNAPLMQFVVYSCVILISWFGAHMIVAQTMTTGELMSFFAYLMQILMSLMMLSMVLIMITIARTSAERIAEVVDEETELKSPESPVTEVPDGRIEFENVSFSYTGQTDDSLCLQDISLSIPAGMTVGILGGTGSAKTTLVQLIPRLYDAIQGRLLVGGIDVREYDLDVLRSQVSMVLQKNVLFSGTVKENLRWGDKNASDEELIRVCELAQAHDFISKMPDGYDTYIEQGGTNVSGGQKQRLCIARALLKKPKILILDDSTSAVDTKTDALLQQALREDLPEATKLIIAQRISSVEKADMIVVLDDGKINGIGTHESLLTDNDIYREVFESQQKGGVPVE